MATEIAKHEPPGKYSKDIAQLMAGINQVKYRLGVQRERRGQCK